ncbi:hypothetical protein ADK60_27095, partial [Streptomyces sp. XY431]
SGSSSQPWAATSARDSGWRVFTPHPGRGARPRSPSPRTRALWRGRAVGIRHAPAPGQEPRGARGGAARRVGQGAIQEGVRQNLPTF